MLTTPRTKKTTRTKSARKPTGTKNDKAKRPAKKTAVTSGGAWMMPSVLGGAREFMPSEDEEPRDFPDEKPQDFPDLKYEPLLSILKSVRDITSSFIKYYVADNYPPNSGVDANAASFENSMDFNYNALVGSVVKLDQQLNSYRVFNS